jgi:hypothetical protein
VRLRGDVGDYRDQPGTTPQHPVRNFFATADSYFTSTGSGAAPAGDMCSAVLSGTVTFPVSFTPVQTSLVTMGTIDMSTRAGALVLGLGQLTPPFPVSFVGAKCPVGVSTSTADGFGMLETSLSLPSPLDDSMSLGPLPALWVTLDSQLALEARNYTDPVVPGASSLDWPRVVPMSPPDVDAAR